MPAGLLPHAAGQQQLPGGHQAHHLTRGEGLHPEPRHRQLLSQGLDNYKLCKNNHRTRGLLLGLTVTVRIIFFSFAKYETVRIRFLFRRVSIVSRN